MPAHTPHGDAQTLKAIYLALAAGVFMFAAVVLFILQPLESALDPGVVRIAWFALAVVATLGAGITRGRLAGGPRGNRTAAIVVWAIAEGQALVGIVGTMLTGDVMTTYASLAVFVWLWLRYPPGSFRAWGS
jgi:hypothetical protein